MKPELTYLRQKEIEKLHRATMAVMEKGGIEFQSEKALELFRTHGFKTEGQRVFFTEKEIMKHVDMVPRQFKLTARNDEKSVIIGGDRPIIDSGDGYVAILTPEGRRPALLKDTLNHIKLVHTGQGIDIGGSHMVTATDIIGPQGLSHTMLMSYYLSDMPVKGLGFGPEYAKISIDLAKIMFGEDYVKKNYVCMGPINPTSPLRWIEEALDLLMAYAEAGQPIEMAPAGMLGTTMPITPAGGIVCANAEVLAGLVLTQMIHPGLPVVPGTTSSATDMKSMMLAMGAPECALMAAALTAVLHSYGLPTRGGGALTDANACDMQAGAESLMNLAIPMLSKTDLIFHTGGMCEGYASFSFEKAIMDEEILSMTNFLTRGLNLEDDELAVEPLLNNAANGGDFLNNPFTFKRFKTEVWNPTMFNRLAHVAWKKLGSVTLEQKAEKIWKERVENFSPALPDAATGKALWAYVSKNYGEIPWLTQETVTAPMFVD